MICVFHENYIVEEFLVILVLHQIHNRLMRNVMSFVLLILVVNTGYAQTPLEDFPLSSVSLHESPFYQAQQTDMEYILELDVDRLLVPFLRDAGVPSEAKPYGNWESSGLDGHIGGHYLSALSLMFASTGNKEVKQRLDYMISRLAECQEKNGNGYVGGIPGGQTMWKEISEGKIEAQSFSLNKKWVPLYNIHKLFAGLRDAYVIAGNKQSLEILVKLCDWFLGVTSNLSDDQIQQMLQSEHGGMNEVFADVSAITGEKKYLVMAEKLSHKKILNPLLASKDELTGMHANTQIPKVVGYKRIADISGNHSWSNAADFFWNTVVTNRSVSIGGNSVREHFHPVTDFSSMIESNQGPETCNSYNMLRLTKLLFLSNPDAKYMDYYERTLYNHILSSQHPEGGFVYFTPMRPRHYRVYSQPEYGFWCCVGSGIENHGKYGEMIYARNQDDIYINLFIASTLEWKQKGITLQQTTKFPYEEGSVVKLTLEKPQQFKIYVRQPGWVNAGAFKVRVNGKEVPVKSSPSSYVAIERKWKTGDVITVDLPMALQLEYLPDKSSWASILYGPIVLAAPTDTTDLKGLRADDSRMGHAAEGKFYPIEEAPVIIKRGEHLLKGITRLEQEPLSFTVSELIYPDRYRNVKLIPFFALHDARYMIYWQVTTPEQLEVIKQQLREKEKKVLELTERTVDWVLPGEQQPEAEHGFKGEKTESGNTDGKAWRRTRAWFSYDLKNKNRAGTILSISYAGNEKNREFDILLNDRIISTVTSPATKEDPIINTEYAIPSEVLDSMTDDVLTVKFVPREGYTTGRIFEVRLLKSK